MNDFDNLISQVSETSIHQATTSETYVELYRQLLGDSLQHDASHIHLHCSPKELVVRYRILNKLKLRCVLPVEAADGFFDAIKLQFRLDRFERRREQLGRLVYFADGIERLIRVSLMNASLGLAAVLTWEKQDLKCLQLHELGLLAEQESAFAQMLQRRVGFIVVSGNPWGSGRRTLGHAALLTVKNTGREALSLECGVSRPLPGILQCEFTAPSNLTPLQWIQAALRRRPDVLFIENNEYLENVDTIRGVIVAARNKCLVVVAMARSFEYLIEYFECLAVPRSASVEAFLGVVEQSLIPRVCPNCTVTYTPKASELRELRIHSAEPSKLLFAKGTGCSACRGSGRRGVVGIHEVATMTDDLRTMFLQKRPEAAIRQHLLDGGMTTLYQSAVHKLVTRQISSATAFAYCLRSWREPKVWINVDAETGLTRHQQRYPLS